MSKPFEMTDEQTKVLRDALAGETEGDTAAVTLALAAIQEYGQEGLVFIALKMIFQLQDRVDALEKAVIELLVWRKQTGFTESREGKMNRRGATFLCQKCGECLDSDLNAARNNALDLSYLDRVWVRDGKRNLSGFYWAETAGPEFRVPASNQGEKLEDFS